MGIRPSGTKSGKRRVCAHLSGRRNQAGGTSSVWHEIARNESLSTSVWYDVTRMEGLSLSIRYGESSRWDFVPSVRSRVMGEGSFSSVRYNESSRRDFVRLLRSHAKREHVLIRLVLGIKQVGLHPFSSKSCKESLSTLVRYAESSKRDFIHPVHSPAIGGLVLVGPVRGIMHAGLRPFGLTSHEKGDCPHQYRMRNHASCTLSV